VAVPSDLISAVERGEVLELERVAAFLEMGLWVSKEDENADRSLFLDEAGVATAAACVAVAGAGGVNMEEEDLKTELGNAETASSGIIKVESSE
jgi:hypothetical protein